MARSTLSKRASKAKAKSAGALSLFRQAAADLEDAAKEHGEVARVAGAVASEYSQLKDEHAQQAQEAGSAATKLRALVGGK